MEKYLKIWQTIWKNDIIQAECKNVMHIVELLLITPFTNAKVERLFSRMNRIKTTLRNRLSTARLETQLRIGEEGCPLADFKADEALEYWLNQKIRRLNGAKPRNYPAEKQSTTASSSAEVIDIAAATLSDLEEFESDECGDL